MKPLGPLLRRVRNVSGATILGTGDVCMVLNPADLLRSIVNVLGKSVYTPAPAVRPDTATRNTRHILLAEDNPMNQQLAVRFSRQPPVFRQLGHAVERAGRLPGAGIDP